MSHPHDPITREWWWSNVVTTESKLQIIKTAIDEFGFKGIDGYIEEVFGEFLCEYTSKHRE